MPVALVDFVMEYPPAGQGDLDLVHCSNAQSTISILGNKRLTPAKCPVYGVDLLYTFYGRPAYKPGVGLPASNIVELAPVCLVLDSGLLASAERVLPFDSGGFPRYQSLLGPNVALPSFELGQDPSAPRRLIRAFFGNTVNYYEQHPTLQEAMLPLSRITPRAYARLIADPSLRAMDDRCGTIEVQFSTTISLNTALKAIIGPAPLFDDPLVQIALADCPNAVSLPYKTYGRAEPTSFAYAIYERVETYFNQKGSFG